MPIERYIVNFCAEIPAPPPGSFEVQTTVLDSVIKFWSPPYNQPIAWVSLPFSHLFECLEIENVITVWHALALERQVLLTSSQLSLLTTCSEILLSLLFPMRWSHAYIPVLPHFLIPILSAPMPYLCGVDRSNLPAVLMELSPSAIIVDLDKNIVNIGPSTPPLPPLPRSYELTLRTKLQENAGMIFREARSLTKNDNCSEGGRHLPIHVKLMADAMWESRLCLFDEAFHLAFTPEAARTNLLNGNDNSALEERDLNDPTAPLRIMTAAEKLNLRKQSQWDAVQEAFLNAYVHILRNYRKFLVFPSKDNENDMYGGAGFRTVEFVQSQLFDMQEFLKQLLDTQMFDDFITKRLYGSGEADVTFFDMAVDGFHKGNKVKDIVGSNLNSGMQRAGNVASSVIGIGHTEGHSNMGPRQTKRFAGLRRMFGGARQNSETARHRAQSAPAKTLNNPNNANKKISFEPLLQSARVHRKLKTLVPPEPNCADLPIRPVENQQANNEASLLTNGSLPDVTAGLHSDGDNDSLTSISTGTRNLDRNSLISLRSSAAGGDRQRPTPGSPRSNSSVKSSSFYKRRQDRLAEALERERKLCYTYNIFPSTLDEDLFGETRPMSQAVLAEFDRQKENSKRFRRRSSAVEMDADTIKSITGKSGDIQSNSMNEPKDPHLAEIATFTVFFMFFTSVVGRELLEMSSDESFSKVNDRTILSTYTVNEEIIGQESETETVNETSEATPEIESKEDSKEESSDGDDRDGKIENEGGEVSMEDKVVDSDEEQQSSASNDQGVDEENQDSTVSDENEDGKESAESGPKEEDDEEKVDADADADNEEKESTVSDGNTEDEESTENSQEDEEEKANADANNENKESTVSDGNTEDKESTESSQEEKDDEEKVDADTENTESDGTGGDTEDKESTENSQEGEDDEGKVTAGANDEDKEPAISDGNNEDRESTENSQEDGKAEVDEKNEDARSVENDDDSVSKESADSNAEHPHNVDVTKKDTNTIKTVLTIDTELDVSDGSVDNNNDGNDDGNSKDYKTPRRRFRDDLSTLQIMEAKETAKAQLNIAFEMLKTMKKRELRADPEAYQCLIDACGRCGDTERATALLGRMHEDGIVADGVVYSCLVGAFSAESAWRKLMGKSDRELPGKFCVGHNFMLIFMK